MELGALDGQLMSQSNSFIQFGWQRILVEGSPQFTERLIKNSPDAFSFNVSICEKDQEIHFKHSRAVGGILEHMTEDFII